MKMAKTPLVLWLTIALTFINMAAEDVSAAPSAEVSMESLNLNPGQKMIQCAPMGSTCGNFIQCCQNLPCTPVVNGLGYYFGVCGNSVPAPTLPNIPNAPGQIQGQVSFPQFPGKK